jgi:hypothetical protein
MLNLFIFSSKAMRKIAQNVGLFVVFLIAFYAVCVVLINRTYISGKRIACWVNPQFAAIGGQDYLVTHNWDSTASYDVVVAGSSHAYRGYDPRIFAKRKLNMYTIGTGYQNTMASLILLENDCQLTPGGLVIIDLFDNTFSGDGMGCFSRLIPNAVSTETAFDLTRAKWDIRLFNALSCYLASDNYRIETPVKEGFIYNGYSESLDSSKVVLDTLINPNTKFNFDQKYLAPLESIIDLANNRKCQVVLASHPAPNTPLNRTFHHAFLAYLEPVLRESKVIYLDYSFHTSFHPRHHFMDANHLNQAGVAIYNELLLDKLDSLKLLNKEH